MKATLLFLFIITATFPNKSNTSDTLNLQTAVKNKKITLSVTGNENGTHYTKPIIAKLTNTSTKPIQITIENGQIFKANDSTIQDVIITKEALISLKVNETKEVTLFGMCIEQYNSGSTFETTYSLAGIASGNLKKLTETIEKRQSFNTLGQYAVWELIETNDLNAISGFDTEEASYYKTLVADMLNVPVPEYDSTNYETNYHDDGLIQRAAESNFKFAFSEDSAVTIAMFDEDNIVVRELYNNPNVASGYHELNFKWDMEVYKAKSYFIRMIVDGEVKINMEMKARRS